MFWGVIQCSYNLVTQVTGNGYIFLVDFVLLLVTLEVCNLVIDLLHFVS
jgi:hypothetical protein